MQIAVEKEPKALLAKPEPALVAGKSGVFYFPEIDGLRLIAFALVFIHHMELPNLSLLGDSAFARGFSLTILGIKANGFIGVDLFFVISGFLISSILLKERVATGTVSLKKFYSRRTYRIFPVYFLFLILGGLLAVCRPEEKGLNAIGSFLAYATFTGNFFMAFRGLKCLVSYSPLWSVCVEEQFYLIFGSVMKKFAANRDKFINGILAVYAINFVLRVVLSMLHSWEYRQYYFNTVTHLDGLLCGVLLAMTASYWMPFLTRQNRLAKVAQVAAAVLLVTTIFAGTNKAVLMTLCPPLFALLLCSTISGGNRFLAHPLMTALGRRTYSMYVVQFACFVYVTSAMTALAPGLHNDNWLFVLGAVLLLGELSWRLVEKPMLDRKQKFAVIQSGPPQLDGIG